MRHALAFIAAIEAALALSFGMSGDVTVAMVFAGAAVWNALMAVMPKD